MRKLFEVKELLQNRGLKLRLKVTNDSFSLEKAVLTVHYLGNHKDIIDLLQGLDNTRIDNGKASDMSYLSIPSPQNPFHLVVRAPKAPGA